MRSFSDVAGYFAFYGVGDSKLTGNGPPERLSAVPVSQNFFPLLGVEPATGQGVHRGRVPEQRSQGRAC